jgi:hypothetical protein
MSISAGVTDGGLAVVEAAGLTKVAEDWENAAGKQPTANKLSNNRCVRYTIFLRAGEPMRLVDAKRWPMVSEPV